VVLASAVLAVSFGFALLCSMVFEPLVAGGRTAAAFVDRLALVMVVVNILAVIGVGLAGVAAVWSRRTDKPDDIDRRCGAVRRGGHARPSGPLPPR
jgi:hypothetical protein